MSILAQGPAPVDTSSNAPSRTDHNWRPAAIDNTPAHHAAVEALLYAQWLAAGVGVEHTPDGVDTAITRRNRDALLPAIEAHGRVSLPAQRGGA